jgi:hypothetical protein
MSNRRSQSRNCQQVSLGCLQLFEDFSTEQPLGSNMFALLPGLRWGTAADNVVVVGAHWDTMPVENMVFTLKKEILSYTI